jgi:hypothetical protein
MRPELREIKGQLAPNGPNTSEPTDMDQSAMARLRFIHSQLCRTNDVLEKTRCCIANEDQSGGEPMNKNPSKPTLDELLSDCETAARTAFDNANHIAQSIGE